MPLSSICAPPEEVGVFRTASELSQYWFDGQIDSTALASGELYLANIRQLPASDNLVSQPGALRNRVLPLPTGSSYMKFALKLCRMSE